MSATGGAHVTAIPPRLTISSEPPPDYRNLTPAECVEILADLGKLRIITSAHRCNGRNDGSYTPKTDEQKAACATYTIRGLPISIYDVAHYVLESVARVDRPDIYGNVTAYGTQGSRIAGKPAALAKQLRAWREPGQEQAE